MGLRKVVLWLIWTEFSLVGRNEKISALSDISLKEEADHEFYPIKKGEFTIIRGPSGGGKTTFLN